MNPTGGRSETNNYKPMSVFLHLEFVSLILLILANFFSQFAIPHLNSCMFCLRALASPRYPIHLRVGFCARWHVWASWVRPTSNRRICVFLFATQWVRLRMWAAFACQPRSAEIRCFFVGMSMFNSRRVVCVLDALALRRRCGILVCWVHACAVHNFSCWLTLCLPGVLGRVWSLNGILRIFLRCMCLLFWIRGSAT